MFCSIIDWPHHSFENFPIQTFHKIKCDSASQSSGFVFKLVANEFHKYMDVA